MRIAFSIIKSAAGSQRAVYSAALFDAASLSDDPAQAGVFLSIDKDGAPFLSINGAPTLEHGRIVAAIARRLDDLRDAKAPATLFRVLRALQECRAVQVVWDSRLRKLRPVGTIRDGATTYSADGTGIAVETADGPEAAKRMAQREAAAIMAEHPEQVATLARWYSLGCPVTATMSGEAPEFIKMESIATDDAERKMAAEPIKYRGREVDDEK